MHVHVFDRFMRDVRGVKCEGEKAGRRQREGRRKRRREGECSRR